MNSSSLLRRLTRGLLQVFAFLSIALVARAGDISGRAIDANTGAYLAGVSVQIAGLSRTAVTDSEGRFRFYGIPAGSHSLRAQYLGYDDVTQTANVPETGEVTVDFNLGSEIVRMEQFVVEGYREGRSKALQQKRTAENVVDIISADSVGNLPDRNVAEALARVPGISLDVDAGEGRFVSIRGIEPNFNNVTLDGATVAAPSVGGREGRAMPLDVIGSSQISQIEVIKSVTPDMDGNALGGTINIKTASGFDRPERFIFGKLEVGHNDDADGTLYDTDITWGDTFLEGKLGIALSANYSKRPYVSHELQANWDESDGQPYISQFELQPADGERVRKGINYNLEFRPEDGTELYIRGIYNLFDEEERQQEFIMESRRDPVFVTPTFVTFNRMRFEQRDFRREIDQTLFNISVGGKRRFGRATVDADVTYSFSEEDVPLIRSVQFRTGNLNYAPGELFELDFGNFYPAFNDQGVTSSDPSLFNLRRFLEDDSLVQEDTWSPRADVQWDFDNMFGGRSGFFKTGAKYTMRSRFVNDNSVRPGNEDLTMADISPPGPGFPVFDGRYTYPSSLEVNESFQYLNAHRDEFTVDPNESASNSVEDDYDITENILGIYLMGSLDINPKLTMLAGLRYEDTDATLKAFEFQEEDGDFRGVVQNEGTFAYDNLLPNLQFRYALTDRSIIRFAFTGTIGRPQYEKASPIAVLEFDRIPIEEDDPESGPLDPDFPFSGSVEIGNPRLSPYESKNFDLSYEYYLQSGGLISVGLFYKDIKNPIYELLQRDQFVVYKDIPFEELQRRTFLNAESARVNGVEFGLQLPFTTFFSGNFLDGFGVDGNLTLVDSKTDIFEREGEDLPFFRQPDKIYNLALYYQKYGFSARIAFNRQTESLRTLGNLDGDLDYWDAPREYTDFQASYKLNEMATIYVNWQNIFKANKDRYQGQPNMIRRSEFYGSYLRGGVRFNF